MQENTPLSDITLTLWFVFTDRSQGLRQVLVTDRGPDELAVSGM